MESGWFPSCFYNAMIHPLGQMVFRGMLWDQGEANMEDTCVSWGCKLASMIDDVRTNLFAQQSAGDGAKLPPLFVTFDQLRPDPFAAGSGVPGYSAAIPFTAYATRVDLQTCLPSDTSEGHAVRKLEVGRRLALAARVVAYGEEPTPTSFGPTIAAVSVGVAALAQGGAAAVAAAAAAAAAPLLLNVTVSLVNADGLHHSDAPDCAGCCAGKGGPLIAGSPLTGDAWLVGLAGGAAPVAVCKDASLGCDGSARIVPGGVELLVEAPAEVAARITNGTAPTVSYIIYGGMGPWFDDERPRAAAPVSALQCVYPHPDRFGIEACSLYNGRGGYDDHAGIAMPAQYFAVE